MSELRDIAYRLDPVTFVREVVKLEPTSWQEELLPAARSLSPCPDGTAGWKDDDRGLGDRSRKAHEQLVNLETSSATPASSTSACPVGTMISASPVRC
jgi:hypothetical protein